MKPAAIACLLLLAGVVPAIACSGSPGSAGGGASGAGGGGGSGADGGRPKDSGARDVEKDAVANEDANPYGVPYPTDDIGTMAREESIRGQRIQNFKFLGYANPKQGSPTIDTGPLVTIALSDFYDPLNKKYKLLHISGDSMWCNPSNEETDMVVPAAAALAEKGIVILQALSEGYTVGTGAVPMDLMSWVQNKGIDYNLVLDPELANLGVFVTEAVIPWNADIDVRTMEILDEGVGYDGMTVMDEEGELAWVESHPPSYACPAGEKLSGNSCVAD
jgi:hypothetical protein